MSLHPKTTHWFAAIVPREQVVYALEALAASGRVELEQERVEDPLVDTRLLRQKLAAASRLIERYRGLLPVETGTSGVVIESPEDAADDAVVFVRQWLAVQLRRQRRQRDGNRRQQNLGLLRECLDAMEAAGESLLGFAHESRFLSKRIYACALRGEQREPEDPSGISRIYHGHAHTFHVVLCLPEHAEAHDRYAAQISHCATVEIPAWLVADWPERHTRIQAELLRQQAELEQLDQDLQQSRHEAALVDALRQLTVLNWYLGHTVSLTEDHRHCCLSGWTSATSAGKLRELLERAGVSARVLFRPAPLDRPAPTRSGDERLVRPFRFFVSMLGAPGANDIDPAPLLVVIVPLLFGMMFPDVGHGLVIAAASLLLAPRYPSLRFLLPCGLAAAGFGWLFGETFGSHAVLPALWVRPLDDPLMVLLAPLIVGAAIILLGLALSGIEAYWRGELRNWLWLDGAVLSLYVSALAALFHPAALVLTGLSLLWYFTGLLVTGKGKPVRRILLGAARLLHSALELALNTLSFVRLGAFALAHTALTHALLEIASLPESPVLQFAVLLLGHALIIVVEGMVVFVQTTRLVLFEFFTRFLRADGRLFRPSAAPAGFIVTQRRSRDD